MGQLTSDQINPVLCVGALPPPVTGMTAMTQVIVDALRKSGPVRCFDWSRGRQLSGFSWRAARTWGAIVSLVKIMLGKRAAREVLYYPVSSGWGQLYDIAIVLAARLRGYKAVLHHHVYSYIDRRDWRTALLNRCLGSTGAHVVHCAQMRDDFLAQYKTEAEFLYLPPTVVAQRTERLPRHRDKSFTLGMLGNLTLAKGLDTALETFERIADARQDVTLVLAGPCHGTVEQQMMEGALARWPQHIEYRGPLYGDAKQQFFADIDVFLFPTRYKNESWGIVLTEALAAHRPVIACRRGCVPWIVRDGSGVVVDQPQDFADEAARTIEQWMDDQQDYETACVQAGSRSQALTEEAERQFAFFLQRIRAL